MVWLLLMALALGWLLWTLWDAFEVMLVPRRLQHEVRPVRFFFQTTWKLYSGLAARVSDAGRREDVLAIYGPLSMVILFALWNLSLLGAFALLQWSIEGWTNGSPTVSYWRQYYFSGTTFFTLGLGDEKPSTAAGRAITMLEAGMGFGFLAIVIGYLPVLYQLFAQREIMVAMLDARAGSPPSAVSLLERFRQNQDDLTQFLAKWEQWSAQLLESHLSYPMLSYYRSQQDQQSWLSALATVMDTCVVLMVCQPNPCTLQAQLTFAMSRHSLVSLQDIFGLPIDKGDASRLPDDQLEALREALAQAGIDLPETGEAKDKLNEFRATYEPYLHSLGTYLLVDVPIWIDPDRQGNWERDPEGDEASRLVHEADDAK